MEFNDEQRMPEFPGFRYYCPSGFQYKRKCTGDKEFLIKGIGLSICA